MYDGATSDQTNYSEKSSLSFEPTHERRLTIQHSSNNNFGLSHQNDSKTWNEQNVYPRQDVSDSYIVFDASGDDEGNESDVEDENEDEEEDEEELDKRCVCLLPFLFSLLGCNAHCCHLDSLGKTVSYLLEVHLLDQVESCYSKKRRQFDQNTSVFALIIKGIIQQYHTYLFRYLYSACSLSLTNCMISISVCIFLFLFHCSCSTASDATLSER